ncbi:flavin-containing monooxygenase [Mycobacterium shimoidei]|uniref:Putative monooxygenase [Mycobacterium tuberculosis H37Rv] n=1 Tax=Mycobacterium shimoidei TaxID=29313 RepID=A0A1E3TEP1_MYCSH|nr:NAD(P)/FAD-dependent oxidoreductase [Mycobacterium shimoidei]MCV7260250.1 NAD(P)/FAD-dependent oxidoreductase [Mycobacterium shimoidei]ODR12861.1 FAD-dependent oxidoreductase [Mycobacterium shimoidei]ORW80747.1 FAD-dependent oxidoreductase [Mycobacterium shimoidei]SRX96305.1 putative monooxygenase [Mycobacterium tuberculosis H37Rv] [Mycobacterium shimoidei]
MDPFFDVLIIGAGISGIGAAYRIRERNPQLRFAILERRENLGGTWDLFRYPGVRSDSDIYTLCFPWEPWTRPEMIVDGPHIWQYLQDTARKHHIAEHIRFNTHVRSVDWDSATDTWTVCAQQHGEDQTFRCRFVFFATGYYDYDNPYQPAFPGIESFAGEVVHPQHWPESLDCTGKRVVVIGSGATAVSLIPTLAQQADHVTMLQRTPSYMISAPKVEPTAVALRKLLPLKVAHWIVRWRNALVGVVLWEVSRRAPEFVKRRLRRTAERNLPAGYDIDTHFKPPYNPWDQRLCFIVDADLYSAIRNGSVDVVTDHIDRVDARGIALKSGQRLDADVIVTATGLQLQALGGIAVSLDGEKINPHDRFVYRRHMLDDVPNLAWSVGYTNASWTLGADMTAQSVAKLLEYMQAHGYTHAYPHLGDTEMPEQPTFNLQAGYVLRALDVLPKSGTRRPWMVSHHFLRDVIDHRLRPLDDQMVFGQVPVDRRQSA